MTTPQFIRDAIKAELAECRKGIEDMDEIAEDRDDDEAATIADCYRDWERSLVRLLELAR